MNILSKSSFLVAIIVGLSVSSVVTLTISIWEWLENPSGIFHNENGTNWTFVYETASSWFVPTFIISSAISALVLLIFKGILLLRKNRESKGSE